MKDTSMKLSFIIFSLLLAAQLSAGRWMWGQSFGGPSLERIWDITSDAANNLFVTGEFQEYLLIGGQTFPCLGSVNSLVAKFGPEGTLAWCRTLGGSGDNSGLGIGVDALGNCYAGGVFTGTLYCQGDSLVSNGIGDGYVVKFDPAGNLQWMRSFGGPANDLVHGLSVNASGQVVAAGWFSDTFTFSPGQNLVSYGGSDIFTLSLNSAGVPLWARQAGSPYVDYGYKAACDNLGNAYTTGVATPGSNFSGLTLPTGGVYVVKYDATGTPQWLLPTVNAQVISISCQPEAAGTQFGAVAGRLTGAGSFGDFAFDTVEGSSDYYWAKFDALTGHWVDLQVQGGTEDDRGRDCHYGQNLAVVGTISGSASFLGQTYISNGADDIMIFDEISGVVTAGGTYSEVPYAICRMPNGNLAISGWHFGSFELNCGIIDSGSEFNQNALIAVYNPSAANAEQVQQPEFLHCHPNPFSGQITVRSDITGPRIMRVFNLKGQLLDSRTVAANADCVWDGRDSRGKEQGPGIYIVDVNGRRARILKLNR